MSDTVHAARVCEYCAETNPEGSTVCASCGRDLAKTPLDTPPVVLPGCLTIIGLLIMIGACLAALLGWSQNFGAVADDISLLGRYGLFGVLLIVLGLAGLWRWFVASTFRPGPELLYIRVFQNRQGMAWLIVSLVAMIGSLGLLYFAQFIYRPDGPLGNAILFILFPLGMIPLFLSVGSFLYIALPATRMTPETHRFASYLWSVSAVCAAVLSLIIAGLLILGSQDLDTWFSVLTAGSCLLILAVVLLALHISIQLAPAIAPDANRYSLRRFIPVVLEGGGIITALVTIGFALGTTWASPQPVDPRVAERAESVVTSNDQWKPYGRASYGVRMMLVPKGCVMMGDSNDPEASPVSRQCLAPFWIDEVEITNQQFDRFWGVSGQASVWKDAHAPRANVAWYQAVNFCSKRGARLPTEAEWEYAARGPDSLIYPWGNEYVADNWSPLPDQGPETPLVGSKPSGASWVGALDMVGSVEEWTSGENLHYEPYPLGDPNRPETPGVPFFALRGGAGAPDFLPRASFRIKASGDPNWKVGFRCARPY